MKCPACDDERTAAGRAVAGGYVLWTCAACGLGFSVPMRAADANWYEGSALYVNAKALHVPLGWHHERFLELVGTAHVRSLFDIGCGTGAFLMRARQAGFATSGIDFDRDDIQRARERHGLEQVEAMSLEDYTRLHPDTTFDVVTLFEVIEHVGDPLAVLRLVRDRLRPGGVLALSTPNSQRGVDPLLEGDLPPNHLTRWNSTALANLVRRAGFEVTALEVKPLRLEDVVGALRARLKLGLARRMLERSLATGDRGLAARAQVAMRIKDAVFTAVALPWWVVARALGKPGVGLLCVAARPR